MAEIKMTNELLKSLPIAEIIYKSYKEGDSLQWCADAANSIIDLIGALERGEYTDLPPLGDSRRFAKLSSHDD